MQEEPPVSFEPVTSCYGTRWYEELFALYLLVVIVMLLARVAQLILAFPRLRAIERLSPPDPERFSALWSRSWDRARSLSKWTALTFLLSCLVCSVSVVNTLSGVGTQKSSVGSWILLDLARRFSEFSLGMLLCAAVYATGFLAEWRLRARWRRFHLSNSLPLSSKD